MWCILVQAFVQASCLCQMQPSKLHSISMALAGRAALTQAAAVLMGDAQFVHESSHSTCQQRLQTQRALSQLIPIRCLSQTLIRPSLRINVTLGSACTWAAAALIEGVGTSSAFGLATGCGANGISTCAQIASDLGTALLF